MAKKVKKQRKKRDFTKVKGVILSILKVGKKIAIAVIGIASFAAFLVVPFLHNCIDHTLAQWIWYPALSILILWSIIGNARSKRPIFKTPLFEFLGKWGNFSAYPIVISIFVFNYYEIDHAWMWVIFGLVALCVPAFFLSLLNFYIKNNQPSKEAKQISGLNVMKSIFLYWFIDLLYMSIFNDWLILTFIFGILSIVIIFFNLTNAFLNGAKSLRFFIVLEMILALIMSGYLIFIIPNDSLQEIVLTIVAALYGGVLTLVGVAWTIKKGDSERQEFDRRNARPFLGIVNCLSGKSITANSNPIQFCRNDTDKSLEMKLCCLLENSDKCIFYLDKVQVDGIDYFPDSSMLISKNEIFAIYIMETNEWREKDKKLRMFITDINYEHRVFDILTGKNSVYERIIEVKDLEVSI